jgi:ribosomal protein L7/L12
MIHKIETDEVRVERIGSGNQFETILEMLSREQIGGVVASPVQQTKIDGVRALFTLLRGYNMTGILIPAIKCVREISPGLSLTEAKDMVEGW